MPTYPSLPIVNSDSRRIVRDGRSEDVAVGGATRVRRFYSADRYDFELRHGALNATQMTALTDFYAANAGAAFDFVWPEDGVTYSVRFGAGGIATKWIAHGVRDATVRLVGA
jgi:hypothetical protein